MTVVPIFPEHLLPDLLRTPAYHALANGFIFVRQNLDEHREGLHEAKQELAQVEADLRESIVLAQVGDTLTEKVKALGPNAQAQQDRIAQLLQGDLDYRAATGKVHSYERSISSLQVELDILQDLRRLAEAETSRDYVYQMKGTAILEGVA